MGLVIHKFIVLSDNCVFKVIWLESFLIFRQTHLWPHFTNGIRDERKKDLIITAYVRSFEIFMFSTCYKKNISQRSDILLGS